MSHRPGASRVLATAAALILALPLIAFAAPPKVIPGELIVRYKDDATPAARTGFCGRADAALVREFRTFKMEHVRLRGMSTEATGAVRENSGSSRNSVISQHDPRPRIVR